MEKKILLFLQNLFPAKFWIPFNRWMTKLGDGGLVWFITMMILYWIPEYHNTSKIMLLTIALQALLVNLLLKPLVRRKRPFHTEKERLMLKKEPKDSSFPSAHSSSSFSMAGVLLFTSFPYWPVFMLIAFLIAQSRLVLFAHWVSDVLAGTIIGLFLAYMMVFHILQF